MLLRIRDVLAVCLASLIGGPGCTSERANPEQLAPVSGTVTYNDKPVKQGTIRFMPMASDGLSAHGEIADGVIKNVTSRKTGDGVRVGRYRVTIIAFDDSYKEEKRTFAGPDPQAVAITAAKVGVPIPVKYSNTDQSGLTAEVTFGINDFQFKLVD